MAPGPVTAEANACRPHLFQSPCLSSTPFNVVLCMPVLVAEARAPASYLLLFVLCCCGLSLSLSFWPLDMEVGVGFLGPDTPARKAPTIAPTVGQSLPGEPTLAAISQTRFSSPAFPQSATLRILVPCPYSTALRSALSLTGTGALAADPANDGRRTCRIRACGLRACRSTTLAGSRVAGRRPGEHVARPLHNLRTNFAGPRQRTGE